MPVIDCIESVLPSLIWAAQESCMEDGLLLDNFIYTDVIAFIEYKSRIIDDRIEYYQKLSFKIPSVIPYGASFPPWKSFHAWIRQNTTTDIFEDCFQLSIILDEDAEGYTKWYHEDGSPLEDYQVFLDGGTIYFEYIYPDNVDPTSLDILEYVMLLFSWYCTTPFSGPDSPYDLRIFVDNRAGVINTARFIKIGDDPPTRKSLNIGRNPRAIQVPGGDAWEEYPFAEYDKDTKLGFGYIPSDRLVLAVQNDENIIHTNDMFGTNLWNDPTTYTPADEPISLDTEIARNMMWKVRISGD